MDKNQLKQRVLRHVISLEVSKGNLKWKVTDLARLSRVSRPLIYYHFGTSKKEILYRSFDMLVEEVYGFTRDRTQMVGSGNLLESVRATQRLFTVNPEYGIIYIRWRAKSSPMHGNYLAIEKRYQDRMRAVFPHLRDDEIKALHALLHGVATAPFLTAPATEIAVEWIAKILQI